MVHQVTFYQSNAFSFYYIPQIAPLPRLDRRPSDSGSESPKESAKKKAREVKNVWEGCAVVNYVTVTMCLL